MKAVNFSTTNPFYSMDRNNIKKIRIISVTCIDTSRILQTTTVFDRPSPLPSGNSCHFKDFAFLNMVAFNTFKDVKGDPADLCTQLKLDLQKFDKLCSGQLGLTGLLVKKLAPVNETGLKPPKLVLPTFKRIHYDWLS